MSESVSNQTESSYSMTGSYLVVNLRNAYSNLYKLNVDVFFGAGVAYMLTICSTVELYF